MSSTDRWAERDVLCSRSYSLDCLLFWDCPRLVVLKTLFGVLKCDRLAICEDSIPKNSLNCEAQIGRVDTEAAERIISFLCFSS